MNPARERIKILGARMAAEADAVLVCYRVAQGFAVEFEGATMVELHFMQAAIARMLNKNMDAIEDAAASGIRGPTLVTP